PARARELAAALPPELRLGTSSWAFPGWRGLVYDRRYSASRLAQEGLAAYARHPLLRAAGIDRTHYQPLGAEELAAYADSVPADFRFVVKAHDAVTLVRWPDLPRFGAQRGGENPSFLDPAYTAEQVVAPFVEGLGAKGGALLFQFAPQEMGSPARFAKRLARFLAALPRGPLYAVELRNRELVTADYAAALAAAGACHCANVHPRMPDVRAQVALAETHRAPALLVRWMLPEGMTYEEAGRKWAPFDKLKRVDRIARRAVAEVTCDALARGQEVLVTVANNAEGCAPLSILGLAEEVARLR
ncbi:MAG TPA: DUF72 domain-containing protein, partial [Thermoanaerobaculia bacterium]|nr:DUF72 domain-containing protein [Thermoanaerobaculia bacterium]